MGEVIRLSDYEEHLIEEYKKLLTERCKQIKLPADELFIDKHDMITTALLSSVRNLREKVKNNE